MEGQPEFKLIHAVDPTKVNLPLRDKFAKLTLSSNKKKKEQKKEDKNMAQVEKRQSASRNLLSQLNDDADVLKPSKEVQIYINPLFRSDSSSIGTEEIQADEETQITAVEEPKYIDEVQPLSEMEHSELMEPLQMSTGDFTQQENNNQLIDILSEKVSSLALSLRSLSLDGAQNVHKVTQHTAKERQKMSSEVKFKQECTTVFHNSVCISLSDDEHEEEHQTDEDDETSSAITVSDSTLSVAGGADAIIDYELVTSNIPHSGETGEEYLPNTFSNDKADRMEAFLRDVSLERVQLECQGSVKVAEKVEEERLRTNHDYEEWRNTKAQQLASADTESMSPYEEEEIKLGVKKSYDACKERILTLDDTVPLSQSQFSMFAFESERRLSSTVASSSQQSEINKEYSDSKRLADDDTEINTHPYNNSYEFRSLNDHSLSINDSTYNPSQESVVPEESVVISETSSEADSYTRSTPRKTSEEVILSEKTVTSGLQSDDLESQLSLIQMSMGSINISAKINIKIHISHQAESDEPSIISGDSDADKNNGNEPNVENIATSLPEKEEDTVVGINIHQKQHKQHADDKIEQADLTIVDALLGDQKLDQLEFMTYAQKLLNECYGQSWRTPSNVRTLKRIGSTGSANSPSSSTKKVSSSTKKNTTMTTKESKDKTPTKEDAEVVEESILDEFSIFRRNIVKTNLDSTRLGIPRQQKHKDANKNIPITTMNSEPRRAKKALMQSDVFKVPQTEVKKRTVTTSRGRIVKERWRNLVVDDSDSEGANASDDDDVNRTENGGELSDKSWEKSCSEEDSNDSDYKIGKTKKGISRSRRGISKSKDKLIYLDLSKDEVSIQEGPPVSPPANNDENFNMRLQDIIRTCRHEDKPKLVATPTTPGTKSKRKLFTLNFGDEEELGGTNAPLPDTPKTLKALIEDEGLLDDIENIYPNGKIPPKFDIFNKQLEAIKTGKPIFKLTPPRSTETPVKSTSARSKVTPVCRTPNNTRSNDKSSTLFKLCTTPDYKYGFLKSLDVCVGKNLCHPDALLYRENFRTKKEELTRILYDLYKEKLFGSDLNVPLIWNKKLCNTAGRCLNKKKMGIRSSAIELSEKVLTSADRLRCTLIHELCHAATWIFHGEGGHGNTWKNWARKANSVFPEIPKIGVCHQYDIEYKYTYKCTLCNAKSHAHSKSKKVENIRCSYCHGAIEIYLNKKDKDGNIMSTPVKEPTGFAKFVKDNYKLYKRPDLKHADVMKILSNEFSALKVRGATAN